MQAAEQLEASLLSWLDLSFLEETARLAGKGIELDDSGKQCGLKVPESLKFSDGHWVIPNPQEAQLGIHFPQDGLPKEVRIFPQLTVLGFKSWFESWFEFFQKERI